MAEMKSNDILERAATIIQDETGTRWPFKELLKWLNDGQREIVLLKPDSYAQNSDYSAKSGTKQEIPSDGVALIDVIRNIDDSDNPGRAIRLEDRRVLDEQRPDWHTETQANEAKLYMFDERDPKRFFVYPPHSGTGKFNVVYAASPPDVALSNVADTWSASVSKSIGDQITANASDGTDYVFECVYANADKTTSSSKPTWPTTFGNVVIDNNVAWRNIGKGIITLDDIYANALLDYILYRAYSKDADYAGNAQRAIAAYEAFLRSIGKLDTRERLNNPYLREQMGAGVAANTQG